MLLIVVVAFVAVVVKLSSIPKAKLGPSDPKEPAPLSSRNANICRVEVEL